MTSPIVPSDECVEPIWVDKADTEAPPRVHGFAAVLWRTLENHRPPGLSRIRWHTPLRGPSLTSLRHRAVAGVTDPHHHRVAVLLAYGPRPVEAGSAICCSDTLVPASMIWPLNICCNGLSDPLVSKESRSIRTVSCDRLGQCAPLVGGGASSSSRCLLCSSRVTWGATAARNQRLRCRSGRDCPLEGNAFLGR